MKLFPPALFTLAKDGYPVLKGFSFGILVPLRKYSVTYLERDMILKSRMPQTLPFGYYLTWVE